MREIAAARTVTVADYMAAANAHYYATRDPLGAAGDFTTAPEISQMFGEMVGIWIADLWTRAGGPAFHYVELGPGRGTLAADALRTAARFDCKPQSLHLVETSPALRAAQSARLPDAEYHDEIDSLPDDLPLIVIANEFFDALPVHQYVATKDGWRERIVVRGGNGITAAPDTVPADEAIPPALRDRAEGTIVETAPAAAAVMHQCSARLARQGGAMLAIDYGYCGPATGDTLQAVKAHRFADPFADPGEVDLTAHVDFAALAHAARRPGTNVFGPVDQGAWLQAMGIDARLQTLVAASPARAADLQGQRDRLVAGDQMGTLFQAMALTGAGWPQPAGFDSSGEIA